MLLGSIQMCGETITTIEIKDMCASLESNNVRLLALRECKVHDKDFKRLMKAVAVSKSLMQLNLNLGMVDLQRVEMLGKALYKNRSLTSLFLHGCPIGDHGTALLTKMLASHPNIVSLDLGDCMITEAAIPFIADLLPPNGAKRGLQDLTLSANPGVSAAGWAKLFVALAASCCLKTLCLDYNNIGDFGAGCLAVALPTLRTLEMLDIEGTGITQYGADIILHTVRNFPVSVKQLVLAENVIRRDTLESITTCLQDEFQDTIASRMAPSETSDSMSTVSSSSSLQAGRIISKQTPKDDHDHEHDEDDVTNEGSSEESEAETIRNGSADGGGDGNNSDEEGIRNDDGTQAPTNGPTNNESSLSTGEAMQQAYAAALEQRSKNHSS